MSDYTQKIGAAALEGAGTVTSVTFTGDGTVLSSTPSSAVTTSGTVTGSLLSQAKNTFLAGPTSGSNAAPTFRTLATSDFIAPTVQKFLSGSGTYTTPTSPRSPLYIRIRAVGGGGGGAGSGTSAGTVAGDGIASTFGTTLISAGGGAHGVSNGSVGGAGGTASLGTGPVGIALSGGYGGSVSAFASSGDLGGMGGSSAFGGAGSSGGSTNGGNGTAGAANTGGGGGGASTVGASTYTGAGGGAGGFVDAIITSPSSPYSYSVGIGGTAGGAGTSGAAGSAGGSGVIIVEEFYQ